MNDHEQISMWKSCENKNFGHKAVRIFDTNSKIALHVYQHSQDMDFDNPEMINSALTLTTKDFFFKHGIPKETREWPCIHSWHLRFIYTFT